MRNHRIYLTDILRAMESIEGFVQDMNLETFQADDKTSSAVVRKLEIMGEAAKNIPEQLRKKHPEVP